MTTIIVIAGGTASGKTTIANQFAQQYDALVIHHDRYYKDIPHPEGYNFDEPEALDNQLLVQNIASLKQGNPAHLPIYDFPSHSRLAETEKIHPRELIIVEGILTLAVPEVREIGDFLIYVNAPDDIRLARRLQRDVVDRGRSVDSVLKQYMNTVRPMHNLHVLPSKKYASLELDGLSDVQSSVDKLSAHINTNT